MSILVRVPHTALHGRAVLLLGLRGVCHVLAGRAAEVAIGPEPRRGLISVLLVTIRLLLMMMVQGQTD